MAFAPEVIFDIGANVGLFAQGAVAAHPAALIHAFEPVSKTYEKLKAGVAGFPRIHPHQLALGAASGNARMYLRSESQWNSLAAANNLPTPEGDSEIITQTTVDAFCEARQITRIDLLKTDTEGFDYEVLNGARGMLENSRIRAVYSEVTFYKNDPTHTQFQAVFETLQRFDLVMYGLYEPGGAGDRMYANALFVDTNLIRSTSGPA